MREFTDLRSNTTPDEIWLLEHPPVFTQGQAGRDANILQITDIPIINSDRGGQVTYHGPGQLIAYVLLDLRRTGLGVRALVEQLEQVVINMLSDYAISAQGRRDAPGVYVNGEKIAALGLRVRRGCTYHGLSVNVSPDLTPFSYINPCGYAGQRVTSMQKLGIDASVAEVARLLSRQMDALFG